MTLFLVQSDHVVWVQARPRAADQTEVRLTTLVPAESDKPDNYWQMNHQITRTTLDEDFALGESIQAGFANAANSELCFGRNEAALSEYNAVVTRHLQA
ncbi:MAG: SRPBCC family protein, partial [Nevskiales bacterium]